MKIILLCGESGVGKTSIALELCKDSKYNLVKSFTDRPKRFNEEKDHFFIDKKDFICTPKEKIAAYSSINGYIYYTIKNQFLEDKINVYIVDLIGMNRIMKNLPKAEVFSVLIKRKKVYIDENRKNRNIKIPTKSDVDIVINNNKSLKTVINTIKKMEEL